MSHAERTQRTGEIVQELAKAPQELARSYTHRKRLANTLREVSMRWETRANGNPEPRRTRSNAFECPTADDGI